MIRAWASSLAVGYGLTAADPSEAPTATLDGKQFGALGFGLALLVTLLAAIAVGTFRR